MKTWWELVKDDHQRDPEALPWVLEMAGASFAVITVPAILFWTQAYWQLALPAGFIALTIGLRELVKRWRP